MKGKCILLNINWRMMRNVGRMDKFAPVIPLELLYINAALKQKGIDSEIIDLWAKNLCLEDVKEKLSESAYIVLSSAPTYIFWRDGTLDAELPKQEMRRIREIAPNAKIILIGPHGTVEPATFFDAPADYIVRGEPDLAVAELIATGGNPKENKVAGVCYRDSGKWDVSSAYTSIPKLSMLPELNYSAVELSTYYWPEPPKGAGVERTTEYEASRGCPFNCIFCFREGFRGMLRRKPLARVAKEARQLKSLGIEYVYLIDECFGADSPWGLGVANILMENGIKFGMQTRPELLNERNIKLLAENGCVKVELGMESADPKILGIIGKGSINLEKLRKDILLLVKHGIRPTLFCILGAPGETKESMAKMFSFIHSLPLDRVEVSPDIMLPYPKTKMWEIAKAEGKDFSGWGDVQRHAGTIGNALSRSEVQREVIRLINSVAKEKRKKEFAELLGKGNPLALLAMLRFLKSSVVLVLPELDIFISRALKDRYTAVFNKKRYLDY